jgi:YYY domain-containing protein
MNLLFDWLGREGGSLLSWWLLTLCAGIAVYPLMFRLARGLPSRGYALSRAAGLLISGFIFWMLNILGLFRNDSGNAAFSAVILFVIGLVGYVTWRDREPILPWLRAHWRLIVVTEAVFAIAFVSWAIVRALNPNLTGTEKPMEMAFLAASRRSSIFPPSDPWMSGYAISYYHFGYILMGAIANLSGVTNGTAFNLSAALTFGLVCVTAFGVGFDLVAARHVEQSLNEQEKPAAKRGKWSPYAVGILAAILLAVMGNLGTAAVELPYQYNALPASYFHWMDIEERDGSSTGCQATQQTPPNCFWWWFRWSRVVRDRNLDGSAVGVQPIDEFPQFSFVLSDIHPHVLALPFVILAFGLMLNLALSKRGPYLWEMLIYLICIGGLAFLNSWDVAFLGLFVGAEALRRLVRNGTGGLTRSDWLSLVGFGALSAIGTGILYLPFFISFRSQAGGILPNVIWPTQFQQFFLMFGTFLVIICAFVGAEVWRARRSEGGSTFNTPLAGQIIVYGIIGLLILVVAASIIAWVSPGIRDVVLRTADQSGGLLALFPSLIARRLQGVLTEGILLAIIFGVIGRLFAREPKRTAGESPIRRVINYSPVTGFVLLMIAAGAILALAPDFVYLRDDFGTRINTLFKFYYQTWALWSIASAYALWSLLGDIATIRLPSPTRAAVGVVATVLIAAGLIYAPLAIYTRAWTESGHVSNSNIAMTLDSGDTLAIGADDYAAITCLSQLAVTMGDKAVVAEGMVDPMAYNNQYGRVSALTGIPTLMGWSNHENQWRGNTYQAARGTRVEDEASLYNTSDWKEVQRVVQKYHITYIYIGPTERQLYAAGGGLTKFDSLTPICKSGNVAVYTTDGIGNLAALSLLTGTNLTGSGS